jgi:hypothetical protein
MENLVLLRNSIYRRADFSSNESQEFIFSQRLAKICAIPNAVELTLDFVFRNFKMKKHGENTSGQKIDPSLVPLAEEQLALFHEKYDRASQILSIVESIDQQIRQIRSATHGLDSELLKSHCKELNECLQSIAELSDLQRNLRCELGRFGSSITFVKTASQLTEFRSNLRNSFFTKTMAEVGIPEEDYFGALEFSVLVGECVLAWLYTHLGINSLADLLVKKREIPIRNQELYSVCFKLALSKKLPNEPMFFPLTNVASTVALGRKIIEEEKSSLSNSFEEYISIATSPNDSLPGIDGSPDNEISRDQIVAFQMFLRAFKAWTVSPGDIEASSLAGNAPDDRSKPPKSKAGRKPKKSTKLEHRIEMEWKTNRFRTYEQCDLYLKLDCGTTKAAIARLAKRKKRAKQPTK